MDGAKSLTELKQRSQKADEIIEKLKHQIEQIKLQTTPEFMAKRVVELKSENEKLKKRVDELKKELEAAEAGKPASSWFSRLSEAIRSIFKLIEGKFNF